MTPADSVAGIIAIVLWVATTLGVLSFIELWVRARRETRRRR